MAAFVYRVLGLVCALTMVWGMAACGKSAASCETTSQCSDGFVCSADGQCESVDATGPQFDAAPACPESTHTCAAPAPAGWSGPVAGTRAGIGETLADCSGNYATEAALVGEALLAQGACSCACSGDAAGVDCGNATVVERQSTNSSDCFLCPIAGTTCNSHPIPSNGVCELIPGNVGTLAAVRVSLAGVTDSGLCSDAAVSNNLSAFFGSDERYCSAEAIAGTCPEAGPCLPIVDDAAFTAMCIFQSGDQECPAAYPEKEPRFEGIDDGRSCTECSCVGPALGTSCGGEVHFGVNTSIDCQSTVQVIATSCISNPISSGGGTAGRYVPDPDETCTLEGGVQSGEATPTGPVTFCCTEAIPAPVLN